MATKNVVPRFDGEGGIGTSAKKWGAGYFVTPAAGDNSNKVATTEYVQTALQNGAPIVKHPTTSAGGAISADTPNYDGGVLLEKGTWLVFVSGAVGFSDALQINANVEIGYNKDNKTFGHDVLCNSQVLAPGVMGVVNLRGTLFLSVENNAGETVYSYVKSEESGYYSYATARYLKISNSPTQDE